MLPCRDLPASRRFYVALPGPHVAGVWDASGHRGCRGAVGSGGGFLEMLAVDCEHPKHQPAFAELAANDKTELQIRVDSVDVWAERLDGSIDFEGPVTRPWGNRYLWLRDPDGVRVALFQGAAE